MTRIARRYLPGPWARLENALLLVAGVVVLGLTVVWPLAFFFVAAVTGRLELQF